MNFDRLRVRLTSVRLNSTRVNQINDFSGFADLIRKITPCESWWVAIRFEILSEKFHLEFNRARHKIIQRSK